MKIVLCKGLPGSGKSYWTKAQIEQHPDRYKRINRDDLRSMIDNGKWGKGREKLIRLAELTLTELYLGHGYIVIVDDCNLSESAQTMWSEFAQSVKATVEIKDFTDVPVEECIERDRHRQNYVGEQVIRKMYKDFLQPKPPILLEDLNLPYAILCDLDGTLALVNDRSPYDAEKCEQDLVNEPVADIVDSYYKAGTTIILVSGRSVLHKPHTLRWLAYYGIDYHFLYMRKEGDSRKDAIVKQEIYQEHIVGKYTIKFVLDDRQQCIHLWRSLGLAALQVAEGDF